MKALTLWQPWAWAVASGAKKIENRPWAPPKSIIGQTIAIHGGKTYDADAEDFLWKRGVRWTPTQMTDWLRATGVIGVARVDGYVQLGQAESDPALDDPMFFGPFGWKLSEIKLLAAPVECKGALGLWSLPADVERAVRAQLDGHDVACGLPTGACCNCYGPGKGLRTA